MASLSLLCLSPFTGSKTSFLLSLFYKLCLGKEITYNRREKWKDARRRAPKGKKRRTCIILYTRFLVVIALMLKLNMLRYVCASIETRFFFFLFFRFSLYVMFAWRVNLSSDILKLHCLLELELEVFLIVHLVDCTLFLSCVLLTSASQSFCILVHVSLKSSASCFFKISDLFQLNEC